MAKKSLPIVPTSNYAKALKEGVSEGVEVIAMQAKVTPEKIDLVKKLPVEI